MKGEVCSKEKNCLFINTAEGTRALLLFHGEYFYDENYKNSGSETLLPMIDGLLNRASARLDDIDVFGACIGPGSFTGLRIGLTTVKTFCYCTGKPCFGVNNLRLNSYNNKSGRVISIADAGNRVCYVARYDGDAEIDCAACMTTDDVKAYIAEHSDFAISTDNKLSEVFGGIAGAGEREMKTAMHRFIDTATDERNILPLYIRKAQPERGKNDL